MTITLAITRYQATKCEDSFAEIYQYIYSSKRNLVGSFASRYKLDEQDVESMINERLLKVLATFEGVADKFRNAVYRSLRNGCIDLYRNRISREKHLTEVMYEDDDGTLNEVYEIITDAPTSDEEDYRITEIQKKRDQRQLTTLLLSKADDKILTSVSAFIKLDSYREAAKLTGVSDKTIKSHIRSLSKQFDVNKSGNYYDYFTTATVYTG